MSTKPTHTAYQVREYQSNGETRSNWTPIGKAWAHDDGQGFNIRLSAMPLDGAIVLRTVKDRKPADEGDEG